MDWLWAPIDAARGHEIGFAVSWHARIMVLAWGVLAPLAVIIARFMKIMPGQDWPRQLDSQTWWRSHWMGQSIVVGLTGVAVAFVMPPNFGSLSLHQWLGYLVLVGVILQVGLGVFRGSKGGPTSPAADGTIRGHHYDMTPWRRAFEALHKALGYGLLILAVLTIIAGLWAANAPVWMWLMLALWWVMLLGAFITLQRRGLAVDTYQAIWGDDPAHPGNQRPAPGWGVTRPGDTKEGQDDVRRNRGDGLRSH